MDAENEGGKSPILPPEMEVLDDKSQTMLICESARIQYLENLIGYLKRQGRENQLIELREQYLVLSQEKSTVIEESREHSSLMKLNLDKKKKLKYLASQKAQDECRRQLYRKVSETKRNEMSGRRAANIDMGFSRSAQHYNEITEAMQKDIDNLQESLFEQKAKVFELSALLTESEERREAAKSFGNIL